MKTLTPAVTANFTTHQLWQLWELLNETCFDGELKKPLYILQEPDLSHLLDRPHPIAGEGDSGQMTGYCDEDPATKRPVLLFLRGLSEHEMLEVMAHEMVHQHLMQKHGYTRMCRMGHGPVFDSYKSTIAKYKGLKLLTDRY